MEEFHTESQPDPEHTEEEGGRGWVRFLFDVLETILLALVIFFAINAVSARIRIESISMQPTLYEGNFVIVNKLAYRLGEPERGDIIVFHYPPDPDREPYIKRVIGLPGDEVFVDDGQVHVNDIPINEPYIKDIPLYEDSWVVPDDSLFVLGDNRNNSSDSHSWGWVPMDNVIGKAEVVYWPPSDWRVLDTNIAAAASP